jgi:hypothetical protein
MLSCQMYFAELLIKYRKVIPGGRARGFSVKNYFAQIFQNFRKFTATFRGLRKLYTIIVPVARPAQSK